MNKVYTKNLNLLKKSNLGLMKKIENLEVVNASIHVGKNNKKTILKKFDFNNKSAYVHSFYNTKKQAKYISEYALKDNPDIVFLFGLGMAYEFREMLKKSPNTRYYIVEPDEEIFKLFLENMDIEFLLQNNNIYFIHSKNSEHIGDFFYNVIQQDRSVKVKFVVLPSYMVIYKELAEKVTKYIKTVINNFRVNFATNFNRHRQWCQNYIANLQYLDSTCNIKALGKNFNNVPAVIVSAGPSLTYNFEYINKIKDKALIVAVGAAAKILEKQNIKAHALGAIEGSKNEENIFKDLKINKNSSLFYSSQLHYTIPNILGKVKFNMNIGCMDKFINKKIKYDTYSMFSGPSIANVIAYNLSQLGCNPIIFLGQDLCYSRNRTYAEGAVKYKKIEKQDFEEKRYIKMKNKIGEDVYTSKPFLAMKNSMEVCIKSHPHIKYLNGTKHGLDIEGAKNIDFNLYFEEEMSNFKEYNIEEMLHNSYNNALKKINNGNVEKVVKGIEEDNDEIINLCKDLLNYIENNAMNNIDINYIKEKEKELYKKDFYCEVIQKLISHIEYMYQGKDYIYKIKLICSYVLDVCLIMKNAFDYEVYGGSNNE